MKFLLALLVISTTKFAHKEIVVKKQYGNISVTTITSDYVEEINKTLIIAQYAEKLSQELQYSGKVYVLFSEQQLEQPSVTSWIPDADGSPETDGIHIMFRFKSFNILGCLNVIENSLLNAKELKKFKNKNLIIYNSKASSIVEKVLSNKIYRPTDIKELEKDSLYSYYILNGKYNLICKRSDIEENLAVLDNILDYKILSHDTVMVFIDPENFKIYQEKVPVRSVSIENPPRYYWPYQAHLSGDNKIIIEFFKFSEQKNRVMIYYLDKNEFIQDLDKALKK